jgi:hypothetical protein
MWNIFSLFILKLRGLDSETINKYLDKCDKIAFKILNKKD